MVLRRLPLFLGKCWDSLVCQPLQVKFAFTTVTFLPMQVLSHSFISLWVTASSRKRVVFLAVQLSNSKLWELSSSVQNLFSNAPYPFVSAFTGYWPSYNVPFHENIYNLSGYTEYVKKYGLDFSYEMAPRAKIFRRDQGKVTDMETMKHIMRYNSMTFLIIL